MPQRKKWLEPREECLRVAVEVIPQKKFPHYGLIEIKSDVNIARIWRIAPFDIEPAVNHVEVHFKTGFLLDTMHDWNIVRRDGKEFIKIDSWAEKKPYWISIYYTRNS